jgi:hypothetical protein
MNNPKPETIRFDQNFDQSIRNKAIKIHNICKIIRQAGFPLRTVAANLKSDSTKVIRQQFGLKTDNPYSMIEFPDKGNDENQKVVDWILTNNLSAKVIDNGVYKFPTSKVFRVIIEFTGKL